MMYAGEEKKIFGFGKKFIRAGSCSAEKRYRKFATFQKLICRRFQRQEVIVYWPERFFLNVSPESDVIKCDPDFLCNILRLKFN
jgi:hypothetical protein